MKTLIGYNEFLNEKKKPVMKYYSFDIDDNLFYLPTVIHMEHLVGDKWVAQDVSTEEFAKIRSDVDNWKPAKNAYSEFQDDGPRGNNAFIEDVKLAISKNDFGPSWEKFIKCLKNGNIFSLITARGHEPDTMRKVVEYIIWNVMTEDDRIEMGANLTAFQDMFAQNFDILREMSLQTLVSAYLDKCDFVGVSSKSFRLKYPGINPQQPEKGKIHALNEFINRVNTYGKQLGADVRFGFSDDDKKTVKTIEKHFGEISSLYDDIIFNVYDTSDKRISKKNIKK